MITPHKVLFLGPVDSPLLAWLREQGEEVVQKDVRITARFVDEGGFASLVSYGYRHIIREPVLERFQGQAVNLHISYLPWNRGADPNFWSFVEDTPKGVTIHYLDQGVDTGDIIAQQSIVFDPAVETLSTSYAKLQIAIQQLFKRHWNDIKHGRCPRQAQAGAGSSHRRADKEQFTYLLHNGWDTAVSVLEQYAAETQLSTSFWETLAGCGLCA